MLHVHVLSTKPCGHSIRMQTPKFWALSFFQRHIDSVVHVLIHGCSKALSFNTLGDEKRTFWELMLRAFLDSGILN